MQKDPIKTPKAKSSKEIVGPILKKWLTVYLTADNEAEKEKAGEELVKIYSEERKMDEVDKYYDKYLKGFISYDTFTREDCLASVDAAVLQTARSEKIKKTFLIKDSEEQEQKIRVLSDGYVANAFEKVLNINIKNKLLEYIAHQNGTSKYMLNIIDTMVKAGQNPMGAENEELIDFLVKLLKPLSERDQEEEDPSEKKKKKAAVQLYRVRRVISDEYSYLREFVECTYTGITPEKQKEFIHTIEKAFLDGKETKMVGGVCLEDDDFFLFENYYLSTKNITVSKYDKKLKFQSRKEKLERIFLNLL